LRPASELPTRAKLFLLAIILVIAGFAAWVTIRLLQRDSEALAILLIALSYLSAIVVGFAVVTATRMLYSLRAVPYLLGRGVRRLLTRRRRV
jgi:hypothetical protein